MNVGTLWRILRQWAGRAVVAVSLLGTVYLPFVGNAPRVARSDSVGLTDISHCEDILRVDGSWSYDWSPMPPACPGIEMVPMIWGRPQLGSEIGGNSAYLLGFNEPNVPNLYSGMTPDEAAILWHDSIEDRYPDRLLVTPSSSNDVQWLRDWRSAYEARYGRAPRMDAIAGHIYGTDLADARRILAEFVQLAREWRLPLWISEWSFAACGVPDAYAASRQFLADLNATPEVARSAWFGSRFDGAEAWWTHPPKPGCLTNLFDSATGMPTAYGDLYVNRSGG